MSEFWSAWVMLFIVVNLGITLFLFVWGLFVHIPVLADGTSGHVWAHGVLREGVRRLPTWWVVLSASSFIAGFAYLALYPGFGSFRGLLDWTSERELAIDHSANRQLGATLRERTRGQSIEAVAADPEALRAGEVIFVDNCAGCHGRDAKGNTALGAPDLTDKDWLYGGDGKSILASVMDGRRGAMPPFAAVLPEQSILDVAHYVASLSGLPHDSLRAQFGKPLFSNCAACHGVEGKGNPALGAPNLTDNTRLYGATVPRAIADIIRRGRNGEMPAWRGRLDEESGALVAAWVYSRSQPAVAAAR